MRALRATLALSAVALLAAACGSGGSGTVDIVGTWNLTAGTTADGDLALIETAPIVLGVSDEGKVSGNAACNRYMGDVDVDGSAVTFGALATTRMACEEPVMALETAYLAALAAVDAGARERDELTLTGPDVELVYTLAG